jgi:hypothetical protein
MKSLGPTETPFQFRLILSIPIASMKDDAKSYSLTVSPDFPASWTKVLDEVIPSFVKERFSPNESWKDKEFDADDVNFFAKGVVELSEFFTEDRTESKLPNYFTTKTFRSSYFLYFFALQGAKFLTIFDRYPEAIRAMLDEASETGVLRIVDVGAGPGTASLALLVYLLDGMRDPKTLKLTLPFKIEIVWIDHNETILKDGEMLLNRILAHFPWVDGDVQLKTEARSWWKHGKEFNFEASLVLFGNVLNETSNDPRVFLHGLAPFFANPKGAGVLMLEPAHRSAAHRLSQIRDELVLRDQPFPLWGPCLHTLKCPLAEGRDYCHFSVPAKLPGAFFRKFSIKLGGVRDWLKFSFVWVASLDSVKAAKPPKGLVRIVSDPLKTPQGSTNQVCRPERVQYMPTPYKPIFRGDVIRDPLLQSKHQKTRN